MNAAHRGRLILLAGAVGGLALAGFGLLAPSAPSQRPGPGEVARVNGVALTRGELERALWRIETDKRNPLSDEERRHVLERLIDDELLVQRGVALGLVESDPTVRKALASAVIASAVADASSAAPAAAELEAFFAENRGYFASSGRARIARIFVRDGDSADARIAAALAALDAGVAPAQVRARSGDLTPLELPDALLPPAKLRELLGPTQAEIALALAPGAHSVPLTGGGGRSILVSVEREPGAIPELAALRPQVEAEWTRRAGERALAAYLGALRREAEIALGAGAPL